MSDGIDIDTEFGMYLDALGVKYDLVVKPGRHGMRVFTMAACDYVMAVAFFAQQGPSVKMMPTSIGIPGLIMARIGDPDEVATRAAARTKEVKAAKKYEANRRKAFRKVTGVDAKTARILLTPGKK